MRKDFESYGSFGGSMPSQKHPLADILARFKSAKEAEGPLREWEKGVDKETVERLSREILGVFETKATNSYSSISDFVDQEKDDLSDRYLVRLGDPLQALSAVRDTKDLEVQHNPSLGKTYENATEWGLKDGPGGLAVAIGEGHGNMRGTRIIYGVEPGPDLHVETVKTPVQIPGKPAYSSERARSVRFVTGTIHPSDWRFAILRLPIDRVPSDLLTEEQQWLQEELIDVRKALEGKPPNERSAFAKSYRGDIKVDAGGQVSVPTIDRVFVFSEGL